MEMAEARLAELSGTEAYRDLVAELAQASTVPLDQIVAKPPQPRDREKIAAKMGEVEKFRTGQGARRTEGGKPDGLRCGNDLAVRAAVSDQFAGEWVANSGVLLPLDPGLFTMMRSELVARASLIARWPAACPRSFQGVIGCWSWGLPSGSSAPNGHVPARSGIDAAGRRMPACVRHQVAIRARNGIVLA